CSDELQPAEFDEDRNENRTDRDDDTDAVDEGTPDVPARATGVEPTGTELEKQYRCEQRSDHSKCPEHCRTLEIRNVPSGRDGIPSIQFGEGRQHATGDDD